jgi:hypothetical protein
VSKHLLCLTVDTDPDGLSGKVTNRQTLRFDSLEQLRSLPEQLAEFPALGRVPITWFVRADGQLESILGSSAYLLEKYDSFWAAARRIGDEIGWHPHLYRQARAEDAAVLIADPREAQDELERLWSELRNSFRPTSFRNGEGWHTPETYATVERMGFRCDSTAIPGRTGGPGHPMNWEDAPNQPYFPASEDLRKAGASRSMIELPMNTWRLRAPHDSVSEKPARLRYINPAVHPHLFAEALRRWENNLAGSTLGLSIWVMIFHPDEVMEAAVDGLYSRSTSALCANLVSIADSIRRMGHEVEWATVSQAAECWRAQQQRLIA